MQAAIKALARAGVVRDEERRGGVRVRLDDPFFAAWLRLFVAAP